MAITITKHAHPMGFVLTFDSKRGKDTPDTCPHDPATYERKPGDRSCHPLTRTDPLHAQHGACYAWPNVVCGECGRDVPDATIYVTAI